MTNFKSETSITIDIMRIIISVLYGILAFGLDNIIGDIDVRIICLETLLGVEG